MMTLHITGFFMTSQILQLDYLAKLILSTRRTRKYFAIKGRCAMSQSKGLKY